MASTLASTMSSVLTTAPLEQLFASAAVIGVVSHLGYFIHGEHHKDATKLLVLFISIPSLLVGVLYFHYHMDAQTTIVRGLGISTAYLSALSASILLYRGFFHRLQSFPGPFFASLSKFYHLALVSNADNHMRLERLHSKYGSYVRYGPSDLSIIDPAAVEAIYGPASTCIKSPFYDTGIPLVSMHQTRSRQLHDLRRKVWLRGFNPKALKDYESRVTGFADFLIQRLASFRGAPVDASHWFNYYSFDVMGQLAFGKSFNMLSQGENHWAIDLLNQAQTYFGTLAHNPWVLIILRSIPGVGSSYGRFVKFCESEMDERRKMTPEKPDISSWILEETKVASNATEERRWLSGDTRLVIVAGSDTTAATLTHLFYHLAQEPAHFNKIREEALQAREADGNFSLVKLAAAPHLNGAINEALRIHPPVLSGVPRTTPKEGIRIGGRHIPGSVNVIVPHYVLFRSAECFEKPLDFIPERWYSKPELIKHKEAFNPFSIGPYACIGKNLALMEIRSVTARIALNFNVVMAPGGDWEVYDQNMKDAFTAVVPRLRLSFKPLDYEIVA